MYGYVIWRMTTEISVMYGSEGFNGYYDYIEYYIKTFFQIKYATEINSRDASSGLRLYTASISQKAVSA